MTEAGILRGLGRPVFCSLEWPRRSSARNLQASASRTLCFFLERVGERSRTGLPGIRVSDLSPWWERLLLRLPTTTTSTSPTYCYSNTTPTPTPTPTLTPTTPTIPTPTPPTRCCDHHSRLCLPVSGCQRFARSTATSFLTSRRRSG